MDNQPSFDRSLFLPLGVGIFALAGICGILVWSRLNEQRAAIEQVPTATFFQYAYIGTEPAITTLTLETPLEGTPLEETPVDEFPTEFPDEPSFPTPVPPPATQFILFTSTSPAIITLPPLQATNTPSRTPSSAFVAPFGAGTYDNTDSRFVYSGNWDPQSGVNGAFQSTLQVSGTVGNSVTFLYTGNVVTIVFQRGPSLGTLRAQLDNTSYLQSQANASTERYEWNLTAANVGTHTVTITHDSGGSVNLDGIIVPVVPTATSTAN
jgi:hypothetical protein